MRMHQSDKCGRQLSIANMASKQPQRLSKGFCGTLWQLLVLLRPLPALFMVALSFLEALLVFKGGSQIFNQSVSHQCSLYTVKTDLHTCSWSSGWPVLPDHCGSTALFVHQNHPDISSTVRMQHHHQSHQSVAGRAASLQVWL